MLTASLLDQGAAARTAEQVADEIDFIGGIIGTGAGTDLTYINTVVMKDSLTLGLQLMADMVRRPTFAPNEVERQRQQAMSGLKVAAEDPDTVASQVIDRLIYGFHPYGLPGSGTAESLATLTRDDIVAYHKQFFVPNNALLAVVGDVSADEAMAGTRKSVWRLGGRRGPHVQADRSSAAHQAGHRRRSARRRADRDPRRSARHSTPPQRIPGDGPGREDSRRRGGEPAAAGVALAAWSHLRRVGGSRNLQVARAVSSRRRTREPMRQPKCCA